MGPKLGRDGGLLEQRGSVRVRKAVVMDVVIRLEVLLTHEHAAEAVDRGVHVQIQDKQPLLEYMRLAEWEPVQHEIFSLRAPTIANATFDNHFRKKQNTRVGL